MTGPQSNTVHVIGAGLAGSEAAWQVAKSGVPVVLHEMRPTRMTEAHRTDGLAELVCSNSFRSDDAANNAVGLLHAEMRRLLGQLSERFAHIIIDSPPAISFTDASILSTMVDGVMLVVHGGRSSRAVVRRAKQQLLDVGAHIFGVVLNNVKLETQDYYYSGYYSSNYYSTETDGGRDGSAGETA